MVWIQTLDFPLGVCGGLATPCAPRPHSQRNSPKNALTLWSVFFFFTYDQSTYLFRWDPDPGFSVGGLRGAGDPLRPQAPQSEEQPKKCAYALERFFSRTTNPHTCFVGIQTLDFPSGVCGGLATPCAPSCGGLATPCAPRPHRERNRGPKGQNERT